MTDLTDSIIARLRGISGVTVTDRGAAYKQGGPTAGNITVAVDVDAAGGNPNLASVAVDIDVWTKGPSTADADALAYQIEGLLHGYMVNTAQLGTVRIWSGSRAPVDDENEKLAHVTMRFTGRGLRRYQ